MPPVKFEDFPYQLDDYFKKLLINVSYVFLSRHDIAARLKDVPALSRRILLSGPKGSVLLQEKILKALANHFGAKLLLVDDSLTHDLPKKTRSSRQVRHFHYSTSTELTSDRLTSMMTSPSSVAGLPAWVSCRFVGPFRSELCAPWTPYWTAAEGSREAPLPSLSKAKRFVSITITRECCLIS